MWKLTHKYNVCERVNNKNSSKNIEIFKRNLLILIDLICSLKSQNLKWGWGWFNDGGTWLSGQGTWLGGERI